MVNRKRRLQCSSERHLTRNAQAPRRTRYGSAADVRGSSPRSPATRSGCPSNAASARLKTLSRRSAAPARAALLESACSAAVKVAKEPPSSRPRTSSRNIASAASRERDERRTRGRRRFATTTLPVALPPPAPALAAPASALGRSGRGLVSRPLERPVGRRPRGDSNSAAPPARTRPAGDTTHPLAAGAASPPSSPPAPPFRRP
mmetsp:Transcript_2268/g.7567  ORF Transcript_2268/g.7567 Transcript_2268/m.7567 type:complete len:204 (+) Transcript_2268:886-1497(+)